jgi:hypothetical protein
MVSNMSVIKHFYTQLKISKQIWVVPEKRRNLILRPLLKINVGSEII